MHQITGYILAHRAHPRDLRNGKSCSQEQNRTKLIDLFKNTQ